MQLVHAQHLLTRIDRANSGEICRTDLTMVDDTLNKCIAGVLVSHAFCTDSLHHLPSG